MKHATFVDGSWSICVIWTLNYYSGLRREWVLSNHRPKAVFFATQIAHLTICISFSS